MSNNKAANFVTRVGIKYSNNLLLGLFFTFATVSLSMIGFPLLWIATAFIVLNHIEHEFSQSAPLALVAVLMIYIISGSIIATFPIFAVMIAAEIYKRHNSIMLSFESLIVLALFSVLLVHLVFPDIASYWLDRFEPIKKLVLNEKSMSPKQIEEAFESMSKVATGLSAISTIFTALLGLIVGAMWDATITKNTKIYDDLLNARMGLIIPVLCLMGIVAWMVNVNWMIDILPIIVGSLSLYGMYVFVCVAWYLFRKPVWIYITLLIGLFTYMRFDLFKVFIVLIAVTDYFANWREIFKKVSVDTK